MTYSTKHNYSLEALEEVASFCIFWDQNQNKLSKRIENTLRDERHLYLQYMFINRAISPLLPSKELIEKWLAPSIGFEIYNLRLEVLRRLFEFSKYEIFKYPLAVINYPNLTELILWKKYHRKIYEQSRNVFNQISTEDIIKAEIDTSPYYDAVKIYYQKKTSDGVSVDYFLDSNAKICQMLSRDFESDRDIKILDIGCGAGGLLMYIRTQFPKAHLFATNFFVDSNIDINLLNDPHFSLKVCTVEDLDFDDNFFDVILSTEVIEHLKNPSEMIEKIKKHLVEDGVFIITAPSAHTRFLSPNPMTYIAGILSTVFENCLPPFHNLYEGLTDLPIVHYAFSHQQFTKMFKEHFTDFKITTTRFTHLRKFYLNDIAEKIPFLSRFGGLIMVHGRKKTLSIIRSR